jgi:hypothetical protein
MRSRTASCSCGQLRIEVQGEPLGVGLCHCLACQLRTGSVFAAVAGFAAPYTVVGTATDYVRVGDQGASFRFRFCPVCGTTLFHTEEGGASRPWPSPSVPSPTRASHPPGLRLRLPPTQLGPAAAGHEDLRQRPSLIIGPRHYSQ